MKKRADEKKQLPAQIPKRASEHTHSVHSDVLGSYTGCPLYDEQPVQDADDL